MRRFPPTTGCKQGQRRIIICNIKAYNGKERWDFIHKAMMEETNIQQFETRLFGN